MNTLRDRLKEKFGFKETTKGLQDLVLFIQIEKQVSYHEGRSDGAKGMREVIRKFPRLSLFFKRF